LRGEFCLTNTRSFKGRHSAPISPITLIYGPNSHGKSTLLRSFVRHCWGTVDQGLQLYFDRMDSLGVDAFLSSLPDRDETLQLSTSYRPPRQPNQHVLIGQERRYARTDTTNEYSCGMLVGGAILGRGADIPFEAKISRAHAQHSATVDVSNRAAEMTDEVIRNRLKTIEKNGEDPLKAFSDVIPTDTFRLCCQARSAIEDNLRLLLLENDFFRSAVNRFDASISDLSHLLSVGQDDHGFLWLVHEQHEDKKLRMLAGLACSFLQSIHVDHLSTYIGPSRRKPESLFEYRYTELSDTDIFSDLGLNIEGLLARVHHLNRTSLLDEGLRLIGVPYQIMLKVLDLGVLGPRLKATIVDPVNDLELPLSSVGFGVSQIIPIVLASTSSSGRICVEQPELHLHPLMQAGVADYIVHTVQRANTPSSWLIETHSEAMMLRIQRRIREGKLDHNDVTVLYVGRIDDRGSVIEELRLNEHGEFIDEWPGGFFEMDFDDIF